MSEEMYIKGKCAVYLRRSQDREDRQQLSVEKQDDIVRNMVRRNKLDAVFFEPEERSARHPGRPVFDEMMKQIDEGKIRYIAVWNLSRLSRNPVDTGRLIYAMDQGKLLAVYTPSRVSRNNPEDKAFMQIEMAFNKKENDDLSVRVREGFAVKNKHGQYPGPAPLGYINGFTSPGVRNILPCPERAPMVRHLFEEAATGLWTLDDICGLAVDMGLTSHRSGGRLAKSTIQDVLRRKLYYGLYHSGGEWFQGSYEPLISIELYDQVQISMGWKTPRNGPRTPNGAFYPYKGVVMCKNCNHNITAYTKPKKLTSGALAQYDYYVCTKKSKRIVCREKQVSDALLSLEVQCNMRDFQISDSDAVECYGWLAQFRDDYVQEKNKNIVRWRQEKRNAEKALDVLDEKLESGVMDDDRYTKRGAVHEATIVRLTKNMNEDDNRATAWFELAKDVFSQSINLGEVFEMANPQERRRLMSLVGSNWALGNKKVELTPRRPFDLLRHCDENTSWRARPDSNRRSSP